MKLPRLFPFLSATAAPRPGGRTDRGFFHAVPAVRRRRRFHRYGIFLSAIAAAAAFVPAASGGPRADITVEGFEWGSGGRGRHAEFSTVTLKNSGRADYSSVRLKAWFYKRGGKRAGSARGTVGGLKAGETKTFKNVRLGIMNSGMDTVKLAVAGAKKAKKKTAETGGKEAAHPLTVSNVDWGGARAGVGTVGGVTVKNPTAMPYGSVRFLVIQKSGGKVVSSTGVMTDTVARASGETIYRNINPGFIRPDTDGLEVIITSAEPLGRKREALITGGVETVTETGKDTAAAVKTGGSEAVPAYDIRVEEFEWGSGIAGAAGIIRRLVLRNASAVRYGELTMMVEFLSRSGGAVISNEFRIKNPPPPGETVKYRNLPVGILSYTPDKDRVRIRVRKGKPAPR